MTITVTEDNGTVHIIENVITYGVWTEDEIDDWIENNHPDYEELNQENLKGFKDEVKEELEGMEDFPLCFDFDSICENDWTHWFDEEEEEDESDCD